MKQKDVNYEFNENQNGIKDLFIFKIIVENVYIMKI